MNDINAPLNDMVYEESSLAGQKMSLAELIVGNSMEKLSLGNKSREQIPPSPAKR